MSWMDDELRRQMLLQDTMQKALGYNDIFNQAKQIAELNDSTRHAREMAALYAPPIHVRDFAVDLIRDSLQKSSLLVPGISHDIREINSLANSGLIDLKAHQDATRYWEQHRQNYTIPETVRLQELATDVFNRNALQLSLSDTVAAMNRMNTPWLDARDPLISATSFTTIHAIGYGVNHTPFGPEFTDSLREQLGDWRDVTSIPPVLLEDPAERTEFYLERGFRAELVDFPPDALDEIVEYAGLSALEDGEYLVWRDRVSPYLGRIEHALRIFVNDIMTEAFGENWTKRIPELTQRWQITKQKRLAECRPEMPHLIHYSELSDLQEIMKRGDHFPFFKPAFGRVQALQEMFMRVLPARHAVAHLGIVTPIDYFTVLAEYGRLRNVIGKKN